MSRKIHRRPSRRDTRRASSIVIPEEVEIIPTRRTAKVLSILDKIEPVDRGMK